MSKPEPNADVQRRAAALIEKVEALRVLHRNKHGAGAPPGAS